MEDKSLKSIMLNLLSDILSIIVTQIFWFFCITMNLLFLYQLFT